LVEEICFSLAAVPIWKDDCPSRDESDITAGSAASMRGSSFPSQLLVGLMGLWYLLFFYLWGSPIDIPGFTYSGIASSGKGTALRIYLGGVVFSY
jgi:hypothetical protein